MERFTFKNIINVFLSSKFCQHTMSCLCWNSLPQNVKDYEGELKSNQYGIATDSCSKCIALAYIICIVPSIDGTCYDYILHVKTKYALMTS